MTKAAAFFDLDKTIIAGRIRERFQARRGTS